MLTIRGCSLVKGCVAFETGFLEINKVKSGLDDLMGFHLSSELSSNSVYLGRMDRRMRLYAGLKSIRTESTSAPHSAYIQMSICS